MNRGAPRKEVTGVAVKMKRIDGEGVALENDLSAVQKLYTDVGHDNESDTWISPVVATALKYGLITNKRFTFEPERDVTRAEAFSMIMKSVCMMPIGDNLNANWQENVYTIAARNGITIRDWSSFSANTPILRSELVTIASRAADWAERTGGCDPKPEWCMVK
jgi:hypothetical protein